MCSAPSLILANPHDDVALCREYPIWKVVISPWALHPNGFKKSNAFISKHRRKFVKLDAQIKEHWESVRQPDWEYRCKVKFKNDLQRFLSTFINAPLKLAVCGSTVSGVGTASSDLDICICAPRLLYPWRCDRSYDGVPRKLTKEDEKARKGRFLRRCMRAMRKEGSLGIHEIEFVDAQIPLLKVAGRVVDEQTGNAFEIYADVSVSNELFVSSLHNSHLIKGYAGVDDRFAPLVNFVKKWSWTAGVRDPQKRRFNSYAMTLLVIHFLQCGLPLPILPNLQDLYPTFFAVDETSFPLVVDFGAELPEPLEEQGEVRCRLNVAELFYTFVSYYASIDLREKVIRVKCGRVSERGRGHHEQQEHDRVCTPHRHAANAEDPIDSHNPGRTVDDWDMVKALFADTLNVFERIDNEEMKKHFLFPDLEDLTGY